MVDDGYLHPIVFVVVVVVVVAVVVVVVVVVAVISPTNFAVGK